MIGGIAYYMTTAYFKDPSEICSPSETDDDGVIVNQLYFEVGDDLLEVPMTASEATTELGWFQHKCFPNMGTHYILYDPQNADTISCDDIPPIQLMYHDNVLHGWVLAQIFDFEMIIPAGTTLQDWLEVNPWEPLSQLGVTFTFNDPPNCLMEEGGLLDNPGVNGQHVYIRDWSQISCDDN